MRNLTQDTGPQTGSSNAPKSRPPILDPPSFWGENALACRFGGRVEALIAGASLGPKLELRDERGVRPSGVHGSHPMSYTLHTLVVRRG
eukprot:COSAG01_NODE_12250_length_1772_cov_18.439665_1_plen_88_part_10